MSKLRIACDLDGVLCDFMGGWSAAYFEWFGREADLKDCTDWDWLWQGTHFEDEAAFWRWIDMARVFETLPPIPGAKGAIASLLVAGHEIVVVTARDKQATNFATHIWLMKHWPRIDRRAHSKHLPEVIFSKTKTDVEAAVWIDDSPTVLAALRDDGRTTIKYQHPYNKAARATFFAKDWNDVTFILSQIEETLG